MRTESRQTLNKAKLLTLFKNELNQIKQSGVLCTIVGLKLKRTDYLRLLKNEIPFHNKNH